DDMKRDQAALYRAKLHVRGGKRRISQGKIAAGISALHDALISALYSYFLSPKLKEALNQEDYQIYNNDDRILFLILKRAGIIDDTFSEEDFSYLASILDQALEGQIRTFDQDFYLVKYDNLMKQLGVLPLIENELPPENPETY
ncbi:MAG: hypothetical protein ACFFDT_30665, partial [Candidatus Hodarchaeota archaeon]